MIMFLNAIWSSMGKIIFLSPRFSKAENNTVSLYQKANTTMSDIYLKGANGIPVVTRSIDDTLTQLRMIVQKMALLMRCVINY